MLTKKLVKFLRLNIKKAKSLRLTFRKTEMRLKKHIDKISKIIKQMLVGIKTWMTVILQIDLFFYLLVVILHTNSRNKN